MTSKKNEFHQLTQITNNLKNYLPFGVLFFHNLPDNPSPGKIAPDGWCWLDLPYDPHYKVKCNNSESMLSHICLELRYMISRGYMRITYKIIDNKVAILRLYLFPEDSKHIEKLVWYREHYNRRGLSIKSHNKAYQKLIRNLITVLDYSEKAWNIEGTRELFSYIMKTDVLLFNSLMPAKDFRLSMIGNQPYITSNQEAELFTFHTKRLTARKPYSKFEDAATNLPNSTEDVLLRQRLINVYNTINSPKLDYDVLDREGKRVVENILNDEIPGFKSSLYNYQRRSVSKMFEKEVYPKAVLMPNVIAINSRESYFDLQRMAALRKPKTYQTSKGGILAENMGLGKTCICLALICVSKYQVSCVKSERMTDYSKGRRSLMNICSDSINKNGVQWKQYRDVLPTTCVRKLDACPGFYEKLEVINQYRKTRASEFKQNKIALNRIYLSSTTLVVIPDNLFHQWKLEIKKHIEDDYLNVLEIPTTITELPTSALDVLKYDVVLISMNSFSKQYQLADSVLKFVHWKRLIIDEGHSMNSRSTRAVQLAKELSVERKWTITGTPTSGLTNLHMEEDNSEYTVKKSFNSRDDLKELGIIISNFLKVEPWCYDQSLWLNTVMKPFKLGLFNADVQLIELLKHLIVRHSIKDVESDIKLPKLHLKPVFLKPSFFDKLSINLFIAVLSTNAVTSERSDKDYMFHPSNKNELRRLITNLQKATFYWTGFSITDVENLLSICTYSLKKNGSLYPQTDLDLLKNSIYVSKSALTNSRWRTAATIHEMNYFISNLPKVFNENSSIANYEIKLDDYNNPIGVYGYPQITSIQKFYHKNRFVKSMEKLSEKVIEDSKKFWKGYWAMNSNNKDGNSKSKSNHKQKKLKNEDLQEIDFENVSSINEMPKWSDKFNALEEESKLFQYKPTDTREPTPIVDNLKNKKKKHKINDSISIEESPRKKIKFTPYPGGRSVSPDSIIPEGNIGTHLRNASILGTASAKLSYMSAKLLENQIRGIKSIVFYEFENSAYYLTEFLDILGLNYLMYSTYIKLGQRSENLAKFDTWNSQANGGITLIMDLKLASHGLTIISATHVYFLNPIWNKTKEAQAIKRSHRIGQTKEVFVETLILENTIEEEMYYKRSNSDEDLEKTKDLELIDDSGMQEYIMRYEFLKMFDNKFVDEFEPVRSFASDNDVLRFSTCQDDDFEDDGIRMYSSEGKVDSSGMRAWRIPLFTEANLNRITENESKIKKPLGEIQKYQLAVEDGSISESSDKPTKRKTAEIIRRLKSERRVRFT